MNILIVEDEDVAAAKLIGILEDYDPAISVLNVIQTKSGLSKWLTSGGEADLIFCDIELRDGNVLPLLEQSTINAAIVFTTAYDQFWKTALKANGIDYLLKPIVAEEVFAVLKKADSLRKIFAMNNSDLFRNLSTYINQNIQPKNYRKRFPVRLNNEVFIIDIEEIMYFKIINGVILAYTKEFKRLPIAEETLNELEEVLDPAAFFRINRSELVHIQFIDSIQMQHGEECYVKLKGSGEKLSVSSSRVAPLKTWINL